MVGRRQSSDQSSDCACPTVSDARESLSLHPLDETKPWECTRRAMPPLQSYDPILIGFVEGKGPVQLHLQAAQDEHGRLPSDFGLLSDVKNRRARRTLNLPAGLAVLDLLRDGNGFPELLAQFYERWGRDFRKDFGVDIARFHRFNDPWTLGQIVEENRAGLADCLAVDVLTYLHVNAFVPLSTLRSIPADRFPEKVKEILAKRHRNPAHEGERGRIAQALALLHALALGKEVGDCTADKLFRQVDRDVENIYWTVFSWFLDRNYQILKVHYDGEFVMKVHLLPVLAATRDGGEVFLAVDAIETTPVFREDTPSVTPICWRKRSTSSPAPWRRCSASPRPWGSSTSMRSDSPIRRGFAGSWSGSPRCISTSGTSRRSTNWKMSSNWRSGYVPQPGESARRASSWSSR